MSDSSDSSDSEPQIRETRSGSGSGSGSDSDSSSRPRRAAAQKSPIIYSDGDSSESDSDRERKEKEAEKNQRKKVTTKKRRRQSSEDDPFEQYRHLFDTRSEYDECMGKSEKERESIIYEKMTKFEEKKTREAIEQRLAEQAEKNADSTPLKKDKKKKEEKRQRRVSSDSDDDEPAVQQRRSAGSSDSELDSEFHHPSEMDKKRKQKKAMADLAQKRKEKEKKDAHKKAALSIDDVFGKEDTDEDSSSSSDSSSNSSSSSSRDSSPDRGSDNDDEQSSIDNKPVDCKEDLVRARLSRHFISQIIHTPFFKDAVVGGYVLLRAGPNRNTKHEFRILKIIDVVETPNTYQLEGTKTNKGFKTRFGKTEKVYTLQYISNSPWSDEYFNEWKTVTSEEDTLPTIDYVKKKESEIKKYRTRNWTSKDIDYMVAQKKKHEVSHVNYALKKADLMRKKEAAQQEGNIDAVQRLLKEIADVDEKADHLEKKRSADISAVQWINERNRTAQRDKFFSGKMDKSFSVTDGDDPFTRKKDKMRVVCGTRGGSSGDPTAPPAPTTIASTPSTTVKKLEAPKPKSAVKKSLIDLHAGISFDIDIDLSSIPVAPTSTDFSKRSTFESDPPAKKSRTALSLDEYRALKAKSAGASSSTS